MDKEALIKELADRKYPFDKTDCPLRRTLKDLAREDYKTKLRKMTEEQVCTLKQSISV